MMVTNHGDYVKLDAGTTILSADQPEKEDNMLDQQKQRGCSGRREQ